MTKNQIEYLKALSQKHYNEGVLQVQRDELAERARSNRAVELETNRSNLERERETNRSNLAREVETNRANVAREFETAKHNRVTETETERSNRAREGLTRSQIGLGYAQLAETNRANLAREAIQSDTLVETNRHNRATEMETNRHNVAGELDTDKANEIKAQEVQGRIDQWLRESGYRGQELEIARDRAKAELQRAKTDRLRFYEQTANDIVNQVKDLFGAGARANSY